MTRLEHAHGVTQAELLKEAVDELKTLTGLLKRVLKSQEAAIKYVQERDAKQPKGGLVPSPEPKGKKEE